MPNHSTQQEILLITHSSFATRQYSEKDDNNSHNLSQEEKLKAACWNGDLREMLPEIFFMSPQEEKLFIWQLREDNHLLALQMAEVPLEIDKYDSIDPHSFMSLQRYS